MRPVKLIVEGFTCYKERQEIDFSSLDLFAIWGPTGAGKTSLLDAMMFALYGEVPRLMNTVAKQSSLISLGKKKLSTVLDFRAGERLYRVTRTLKHKGAADPMLEEIVGDSTQP